MVVTEEVDVKAVGDVPPGVITATELHGNKYILLNIGGEFHCYSGTCPHAGGPLSEGILVEGSLICPWHGWEFDGVSGSCKTVQGESLKKYLVVVRDGMIAIEP